MVEGQKCAIEGCMNILKKTEGRICQMHRSRKFRHGDYNISPNWPNLKKGKPCLTKYGYIRINVDGKRVLQHRYIMEQSLGRKLARDERIHHINGNKTDNRIENLELMKNNGDHMKKYHNDGWKQRETGGEVPPEIIHKIINYIYTEPQTFDECFCGREIEARNLCSRHYQWAYKHKLFTPHT